MTSVMVLLNNTSNVIDKVTMRQKEQMKVVRVLLVRGKFVHTVMCLDIQSAYLVLLAGQVLCTIRYKLYYLLFRQFKTTARRRKRLSIITV